MVTVDSPTVPETGATYFGGAGGGDDSQAARKRTTDAVAASEAVRMISPLS
jgi:hypothetical protein